jgi:ABC-type arginine transport system ATPase subunit
MNLGIAPAAIAVVQVISWMVENRIESAIAAQYAAAQFDYFRAMSDQEITDLVFELSRQFPKYKDWEWYNIVNSLRKYGALTPILPDQQIVPPPTEKASTATGWIVLAVVAALLLMEIR